MGLLPDDKDLGVVIQNYLAAIGIEVKLDVMDPGRYWGKIFVDGWEGLHLGVSAINPEYCVGWLDHFGPAPVVKFVSLAKGAEYLKICEKLVKAPDVKTMRDLTKEMITQASEDAMFIPLYYDVGVGIMQDNVHSTYYTALDWTGWTFWNDWKGK
jgi:ABC-type transport system substrate-binding protein